MTSYETVVRWEFDWTDSWEKIWNRAYVDRWSALFDAPVPVGGRSPFFHPDIVWAWYESLARTHKAWPAFVTARSSCGHAALFPLVRFPPTWRKPGVWRLQPVGGRHFDYHDPIVNAPAGTRALLDDRFWSALNKAVSRRTGYGFCEFGPVRVREACRGAASRWRDGGISPYLDLRAYADFEAYFRSRKKALRDDVKRQIHRLEKCGEVRFLECGPDVPADPAWVQRLLQARRRRYPDAEQSEAFFQALCTRAQKNGPVHVSVLLVDGLDVSWHIGFIADGVYSYYVPSFDRAYEAYSPGKIHLFYLLRAAFAKGLSGFDFLRGLETYKSPWTDGVQVCSYRTKWVCSRWLPSSP